MDYPRKSEGALDWNLDEKIEQTISPEKWLQFLRNTKVMVFFGIPSIIKRYVPEECFEKKI